MLTHKPRQLRLQMKPTFDGRRTEIAYRAVILGVPRSGKSRLAAHLAERLNLNHYAVDSLVSAFGEVFPEVGVGRQFEDSASATSLEPFLLRWVCHLDYERIGYVLEGYHITVMTAAALAEQGLRVAVLGLEPGATEQKCREIRAFSRKGDWSEGLSDSDLFDLVVRYQAESAKLRDECADHGLAYFGMGCGAEADWDSALTHLTPTA